MEKIMKFRCKAGDLAVVIDAHNCCNIGRIVKVANLHNGEGVLGFHNAGDVWLVESGLLMTWNFGNKRFLRKCGPVPDVKLQPIRGASIGRKVASHHVVSMFA
jgi:hypothetical protein